MLLKLQLLALCAGVMLGQNEPALVGMPEVEVTLTGTLDTLDNPEINNASGRDIIGYVLHFRDAYGDGPIDPETVTRHIHFNRPVETVFGLE